MRGEGWCLGDAHESAGTRVDLEERQVPDGLRRCHGLGGSARGGGVVAPRPSFTMKLLIASLPPTSCKNNKT